MQSFQTITRLSNWIIMQQLQSKAWSTFHCLLRHLYYSLVSYFITFSSTPALYDTVSRPSRRNINKPIQHRIASRSSIAISTSRFSIALSTSRFSIAQSTSRSSIASYIHASSRIQSPFTTKQSETPRPPTCDSVSFNLRLRVHLSTNQLPQHHNLKPPQLCNQLCTTVSTAHSAIQHGHSLLTFSFASQFADVTLTKSLGLRKHVKPFKCSISFLSRFLQHVQSVPQLTPYSSRLLLHSKSATASPLSLRTWIYRLTHSFMYN